VVNNLSGTGPDQEKANVGHIELSQAPREVSCCAMELT